MIRDGELAFEFIAVPEKVVSGGVPVLPFSIEPYPQ
jgi:hypothetical protein